MDVTIVLGQNPTDKIIAFGQILTVALEKAGHRIVSPTSGYTVIIFLGYHPRDNTFVHELIEGLEFGGYTIIYHPELYQHPELFDLTQVPTDSEAHNYTLALTEIPPIIKQLSY